MGNPRVAINCTNGAVPASRCDAIARRHTERHCAWRGFQIQARMSRGNSPFDTSWSAHALN